MATKAKKPTGRPRAKIDRKQFENLCGIQCTELEICDWFNVSDKTLDKWCHETYNAPFSVVFRQKRGMGRVSLRRSQFQMAQKNPTMAIWLGKQYLDQTDKQESVVAVISDETRDAVAELVDAVREKQGGKVEVD